LRPAHAALHGGCVSPDKGGSQVVGAVEIYEGNRVNRLKRYDYPKLIAFSANNNFARSSPLAKRAFECRRREAVRSGTQV